MTFKSTVKILCGVLLALALSVPLWHYWDRHAVVSDTAQVREDETLQLQRTVAGFQGLAEQYRGDDAVRRGSHAKSHACVRALFEMGENLDESLRHGMFSVPGGMYKAWIRFSNGHFDIRNTQDFKEDARGFALKVLDPPGEPIEVEPHGTPAHDFLLTNSPVFFARDADDYNDLVEKPEDFVGWFFPSWWNPYNWKLQELLAAKRTLTQTPKSLLETSYFSITPYKLGEHNVKYAVWPCGEPSGDAAGETPLAEQPVGEDYLGQTLRKELAEGAACFRFMVQKQDLRKQMPLDDPTIEWKEGDAPFVEVAQVYVPRQDIAAEERERGAFCEHLTFSPWHALEENRPIGELNRLRRAAYAGSSAYRHGQNRTEAPDYLYW